MQVINESHLLATSSRLIMQWRAGYSSMLSLRRRKFAKSWAELTIQESATVDLVISSVRWMNKKIVIMFLFYLFVLHTR